MMIYFTTNLTHIIQKQVFNDSRQLFGARDDIFLKDVISCTVGKKYWFYYFPYLLSNNLIQQKLYEG